MITRSLAVDVVMAISSATVSRRPPRTPLSRKGCRDGIIRGPPARSPKMKNRLLPGFLLFLVSSLPCAAGAQSAPAASGPFHELDVSAGRWVYHGHFVGGKGAHPGDWTWHEDCRWSANRVF